jgi:hypothetical protein
MANDPYSKKHLPEYVTVTELAAGNAPTAEHVTVLNRAIDSGTRLSALVTLDGLTSRELVRAFALNEMGFAAVVRGINRAKWATAEPSTVNWADCTGVSLVLGRRGSSAIIWIYGKTSCRPRFTRAQSTLLYVTLQT